MKNPNPIEKFSLQVRAEGLSIMTTAALLDLISLEPDDRSLKGLTEKREWLAKPALEELSRLEEARFIEGKPSRISINWKSLGLNLLEADLSPGKPPSAVLTLQTAFRRLQQPPSAVKRTVQQTDLATFRHICRFLTKNGLENRSEELLKQYFQVVHSRTDKFPTPCSFLSWLQFKFTAKPK